MLGGIEAVLAVVKKKSAIKSIQRGAAAGAGAVVITEVDNTKSMVLSFSQGSAGYVAARGTFSLNTTYGGAYSEMQTLNADSPQTPTLSGGTTDLTVAQYGAYMQDDTHIYCTGACRWEVIEFV